MFFDIILPTIRRKLGTNFRKRLGVYSTKIGKKDTHKKPGVIPFDIKKQLTEVIKIIFCLLT